MPEKKMKTAVLSLFIVCPVISLQAHTGNPSGNPSDNLPAASAGAAVYGTTSVLDYSPWYSAVPDPDQLDSWLKAQATGSRIGKTEFSRFFSSFYTSALNTEAIESAGMEPVRPLLNQVDLIQSWDDFPSALGVLHRYGIPSFFSLKSAGGTLFPVFNRPDQPGFSSGKKADWVRTLLELTDYPQVDLAKMEEGILRTGAAWEDLKRSTGSPSENPGDFNWSRYERSLSGAGKTQAIRHEHSVQNALGGLDSRITLEELKSYLKFRILEESAPYLSYPFRSVHQTFFESGKYASRPAEVLHLTDSILGPEISRCGFPKLLTRSAAESLRNLVSLEKKALAEKVMSAGWLSGEEKSDLSRRLSELDIRFVMPEELNSLVEISFSPDRFYSNILKMKAWKTAHEIQVDHQELRPAVYHRESNRLELTAGIFLQPLTDGTDAGWNKAGMLIRTEICRALSSCGILSQPDELQPLLTSL